MKKRILKNNSGLTENVTKNTASDKTNVFKSKAAFLLKVLVVVIIETVIVLFCDNKEYFVGDQSNNHTQRKWRSYYRFTNHEHKQADIVVFGNSHASSGVEPYLVSMLTGSYCYILNTPASGVIDAYFNLKEILRQQKKPALVILETFCLNSEETSVEWSRIMSFESKENSWQKFLSMFYMFNANEWVKLWSPTIRNHSFLYTNPKQIAFNRKFMGRAKNPDRAKLDLGRFSHGDEGLTDSTLKKYLTSGAPIKTSTHFISKNNIKYLLKLNELCKANGIKLMLFTAPMYSKTFDNYALKKKIDLETLKILEDVKWLDLQQDYDTTLYTKSAFRNEYNSSQHNTSHGMNLNSYLLTKFILANYGGILPNRTNDSEWIKDFTATDLDFFIHHEVDSVRDRCKLLAKDTVIGKFSIKELIVKKEDKLQTMILKLNTITGLKNQIRLDLACEIKNKPFIVVVDLPLRKEIIPPNYSVYMASMSKDVTFTKLLKME